MVVCKRSRNGNGEPRHVAPAARGETGRKSRLGQGGPVFLPRRRPSAIAETLLAHHADAEQVTAYDDLWFARRPSN